MAEKNGKALDAVLRAIGAKLLGTQDTPDIHDAFFIGVESTLAPGATDIQRFTLDIDADYLIIGAVGHVHDNAAANVTVRVPDPAILVSLGQSQSGRLLQNIPLHWNTIIGRPEHHRPWPAPKHLNGGTTISITQTSFVPGGGLTLRSRITFWGYKIFPR